MCCKCLRNSNDDIDDADEKPTYILYRGKDYYFMHCCEQQCLARIKDAKRMYTIEPRLSFIAAHCAVVQSAISDKNLPSVFAEIICSFLVILDRNVWWISEYNMFCHGAINEWFNTEAECQRAVKGALYMESERARDSTKWDRERPVIIGLFGQPWKWDAMEGVGKSSLVQRFSSGSFFAENETNEVVTKMIKVKGIKPVRIEIHDSAERINTRYITSEWLDNIDVVLLCFAIHKRDTLDSCLALLRIAERRLVPWQTKRYHGRAFVLVGCQMDRMYDPEPEDHAFEKEMEQNYTCAQALSVMLNIPFFETSAKLDINVDAMFEQIVYEYWIQKRCDTINWHYVLDSNDGFGGKPRYPCCEAKHSFSQREHSFSRREYSFSRGIQRDDSGNEICSYHMPVANDRDYSISLGIQHDDSIEEIWS